MVTMNTEDALQQYLNSLSPLPGAVLYRDQLAWKALAPGDSGETLILGDDSLPKWGLGQGYNPALTEFVGSSAYYRDSWVPASNQLTAMFLIRCAPQAGPNGRYPFVTSANSAATRRFHTFIRDETHASEGKLNVSVRDENGTGVFGATTPTRIDDEQRHLGFVTLDFDNGLGGFWVDGELIASNSNTATLRTGTHYLDIGGTPIIGSSWLNGDMGYCFWSDTYTADLSNVPTDPEHLPFIDPATFARFGHFPLWFNPYCEMDDNQGTESNMSPNGTINLISH